MEHLCTAMLLDTHGYTRLTKAVQPLGFWRRSVLLTARKHLCNTVVPRLS